MKVDEIYQMRKELYDMGFKDSCQTYNGVINYHLINEENNDVYLQISLKNTDLYPTLIVDRFDWDTMEQSTTYLPMTLVTTIELIKESIKNLKFMFV